MNTRITEGEYKGKPILQFWDEDWTWKEGETPRPFLQFGTKKAHVIMANVPAIKEFLEAHKEGEE